MIEQFQKILRTPKLTPSQLLGKTQDLILCTFEEIFSHNLNLDILHKIYEEVLGPNIFPSNNQITITMEQQITLNYQLVDYFISLIKMHFINMQTYTALQDQTQKAQATIRSHIKIQQQMKMYLQYLESKINKMQKQLINCSHQPEHLKRQILLLQNRQAIMQRQKVNFLKKNEKLQRQIEILKKQLQSLTSSNQSIRNSHIFKKYLNQASTRHRNANLKEIYEQTPYKNGSQSYLASQRLSNEQKQSKQDKQISYRAPRHVYDLTQKKKTFFLPSSFI